MGADLLVLSGSSDFGALLHGPSTAAAVASFAHWAVAFTVLLVVDALFAAVGTEAARRVVAAATVAVGVLATAVAAAVAIGPAARRHRRRAAGLPVGRAARRQRAGRHAARALVPGDAEHVVPAAAAVDLRGVRAPSRSTARSSPSRCSARGGAAQRLISGDQAFLFWLLVIGSGVLFTAAVNAFTLYFARIRANQPATAMLYVLIISVVMGLVPAHLLYLVTGVAV